MLVLPGLAFSENPEGLKRWVRTDIEGGECILNISCEVRILWDIGAVKCCVLSRLASYGRTHYIGAVCCIVGKWALDVGSVLCLLLFHPFLNLDVGFRASSNVGLVWFELVFVCVLGECLGCYSRSCEQ